MVTSQGKVCYAFLYLNVSIAYSRNNVDEHYRLDNRCYASENNKQRVPTTARMISMTVITAVIRVARALTMTVMETISISQGTVQK
jgi:hypothetical protein